MHIVTAQNGGQNIYARQTMELLQSVYLKPEDQSSSVKGVYHRKFCKKETQVSDHINLMEEDDERESLSSLSSVSTQRKG